MNNRMAILAFLLVTLLFAGCVKLTLYQKIHPDKSSDMQLDMDFSNLYDMMKSFNQSMSLADFDEQLNKKTCPDLIKNLTKPEASELTCSAKDGKVTIKGRYKETPGLSRDETLFENIYTYRIEQFGNADSFNMSNISKNAASLMGLEMKLIVEMPGEIVETNGKVEDKNKAVFDLIDLASKNEKPYVKSKETRLDMVIAAVLAIIIIVAVIFLLIRRRQQQ